MANAILTLVVSSACGPSSPSFLLEQFDSSSATSMENASVGEGILFHLNFEFDPIGDKPIRLRSANLLGVPEGMIVDGIWAIRFSEAGQKVGTDRGSGIDEVRPYFHPVSDVVLDSKCPPESHCLHRKDGTVSHDWQLIAEVHVTRHGKFETEGYEIVYESDGTRYRQRFEQSVLCVSSPEGPCLAPL